MNDAVPGARGSNGTATAALHAHRRAVWALGYRMLGTVADADDLVQDTALRLLERPPPDLERDLRPWLIRVAANLAKDRLRRRRRTPYAGPWLPAPLADVEALLVDESSLWGAPGPTSDALLSRAESLRYAFLVALEALTPQQRAVLLLRDVFGLSTQEVAELLELSVSNAKVTLHRARRALEGYEPSAAPAAEALGVVGALMACLSARDVASAASLLAADVVATTDGGGHFAAARKHVIGAAHVVTFLLGLQEKFGHDSEVAPLAVHGAPALLLTHRAPERYTVSVAPVQAIIFDVDARGHLRRLWTQMMPEKLRGVTDLEGSAGT